MMRAGTGPTAFRPVAGTHPDRNEEQEMNRLTVLTVALAAFASLSTTAPLAQEAPVDPSLLTEAMTDRFDTLIATVERQRADIVQIQTYLDSADGVIAEILVRRLQQERTEVVDEGVRLGTAVAEQADAGVDIGGYRLTTTAMLRANLAVGDAAWAALIDGTEYPASDLTAAEQAVRNMRFVDTQREVNRIIALLNDSYALLDRLGDPADDAVADFADRVRERAINGSVYLLMAQNTAAAARASAAAVPDDTEIAAQVRVADVLVTQTANLFGSVIGVLEGFGDDTAYYRQQVITATGELTPDAFNVSVIGQLISQWTRGIVDSIGEHGPTMVLRALLFALIVFVFYKVSRIVHRLTQHGLDRSNAQLSQLLKRMLVSVAANGVLAVGFLIALGQLGISIGPLLAGLGIAGFIIGFALQDTLANFASGLMILFYRPYDMGDIVELGGVVGKVDQMSLVNTTINTFDNQRIIVPNSTIWGNTIKNVTAETIRRVDMIFGISYSDDIPKTEEVLRDIVKSHELVLAEPEPIVRLHELGDSSVNFIVRPWTQTTNYWDVYWDITRAVKLRFDEAGISIPFPQRDVHLYSTDAAAGKASPAGAGDV